MCRAHDCSTRASLHHEFHQTSWIMKWLMKKAHEYKFSVCCRSVWCMYHIVASLCFSCIITASSFMFYVRIETYTACFMILTSKAKSMFHIVRHHRKRWISHSIRTFLGHCHRAFKSTSVTTLLNSTLSLISCRFISRRKVDSDQFIFSYVQEKTRHSQMPENLWLKLNLPLFLYFVRCIKDIVSCRTAFLVVWESTAVHASKERRMTCCGPIFLWFQMALTGPKSETQLKAYVKRTRTERSREMTTQVEWLGSFFHSIGNHSPSSFSCFTFTFRQTNLSLTCL